MRLIALSLLCLFMFTACEQRAEESFVPLFNGKDLSGWEGLPGFWSVKDGVIVGESTPDKKLTSNTFLIWRGGDVEDCELHFDVRLAANIENNSGVMYRSKELTEKNYFVMKGYQCDIQTGPEHFGKMYDEQGRGRICMAGQKAEISSGDKKQTVLGTTVPADQLKAAEKKGEWNSIVVIAKGQHVQHFVNGVLVVDLLDHDEQLRSAKGLIGLQLHMGKPMRIEFRNIELKRLAP